MNTDEQSAHLMPKAVDRWDSVRISTALSASTYAALHEFMKGEGGDMRDAVIETAIKAHLESEDRAASGMLPGMEGPAHG